MTIGGISLNLRRVLPAVIVISALALAGCASSPPPVSEKVQKAYEAGVTLPPSPAPVDPLAKGRADGVLSTYFIGDSLTDGWNATEQPKSFRPLVAAGLEAGGKVDATADFKAGANLAQVAALANIPAAPDLVVLELGTNDVNKTDLGAFRANLESLLTRLTAAKPVLVCVGTWQFGTTQGFDTQIQQACEARGGKFVKIGDLRENPATVAPKGSAVYPLAADGNHPNDAGHAEIARRVLAALAP
ncbi:MULTISPECIES: SGNH/GDSL hydrolase family protein [unclassified Arthrobacter]|uniref:SGNH/GDSL hydrolase family protein n=1 Tax=unclassified Arthrobacter TaxID=235627 RepID=UPI00254CA620|nr:SGNH/GDSL hydrolase family protein [Arthrobacter sp. efr-133-TYG-120]